MLCEEAIKVLDIRLSVALVFIFIALTGIYVWLRHIEESLKKQ